MEALETFLGNKKYFMGDKVCNEDPAVFANVSQFINHVRGPLNDYIMSKKLKFFSSMLSSPFTWISLF